MTLALSDLRKKLLFRAWHRGTREADLLMGRFAEAHMADWSDTQVAQFDALLAETDPDIYDWLTGRLPHPDADFAPLLLELQKFYRMNDA